MKQEVLIKVVSNSPKSRAKALKIAVAASGVVSVALKGEDRDQMEICGEDIDSADLIKLLRKKVCCHAELLSVKPIDKTEDTTKNTSSEAVSVQQQHPLVWTTCYYPYQEVPYPSPNCTIM